MNGRYGTNKRKRESSEDTVMEDMVAQAKITIYQLKGGNNGQISNPFSPTSAYQGHSNPTQVALSSQTTQQGLLLHEAFICEHCKMKFENKDKLWSHTLKVPHGYNDEGQVVIVPPGYGLIENARIAPLTEEYYLDESCRITKKPTPPTPRVSNKPVLPAVVNPPPFFEPGCPTTGVFLPVGTKGTPNYPKTLTWHCPWNGCDKKNWKIWRVNRHINTTHVQIRRSYSICSCGQAYRTKAEGGGTPGFNRS